MELQDKTALITGSSRGIGRATALLFAKSGANLAINYKTNDQAANQTLDEIGQAGVKAVLVKGDISDYEEAKQVINQTKQELGSIDFLINNAGIVSWKPMLEENITYLHKLIDTNIKGVINTTYLTLPIMKDQGGGVIVNIASGAGKTGYPNLAVYSATKFAVLGFTQGIAQEAKDNNIRIYAVCPGMTATDMTGQAGTPPEKVAQRILDTAAEQLHLQPGQDTEIYS